MDLIDGKAEQIVTIARRNNSLTLQQALEYQAEILLITNAARANFTQLYMELTHGRH
jgi:hypothetical protein